MHLETLIFFAALCLAHSKLLQSPEDTEAVVGDNVTLKCRTDSSGTFEWRYQSPDATSFEIVYKPRWKHINGRNKERYSVDPNTATGQYDLTIKGVQPGDAGKYTCDDGQSSHAELSVFDRYPSDGFCKMTSISNGNQNDCGLKSVTMSCDLSYKGNHNLSLEWREGENMIPSIDNKGPNGLITSSIQLQEGQIEAAKYTCRVRYHASAKTSRFTWSSTVNVTPNATAISSSYGGCDLQTVDCSDGNSPHCKYTWMDDTGKEVSSSSSMAMSGRPNGNYSCLATCSVHSASCSYVAKILNYNCQVLSSEATSTTNRLLGTEMLPLFQPAPEETTSAWVYVPAILVAGTVLLTISILLIFRRSLRNCRTRTNARHDADAADYDRNNTAIEMTHLNAPTSQDPETRLTVDTTPS